MTISFSLPYWADLHAHFRQGPALGDFLRAHAEMGCYAVLAMPNTKPPVAKILKSDGGDNWSIEGYLDDIKQASGDVFDDVIVPLYLTKETTPAMIEAGAKSGLLRAAKYYPPHGTTNADFGQPLLSYLDNDVFKAMAESGVTLCVHGEEHGIHGPDYFDRDTNAEDIFYRERLPRVVDTLPDLNIIAEHITTKTACDFVIQAGDQIGATVTPQHLLYTVSDLLQGLKYHLYCLPLVKFARDRDALRNAVTDPDNVKFFAGTDSAPHFDKVTECGCAAGCFTGRIAPQLYAQGFEEAGCDLSSQSNQEIFKKFLCETGPAFYGLKSSDKTFSLTKTPQKVDALPTADKDVLPLPLGLGQSEIPWSISV